MISKEAQKSIKRYKKYASFISSFYRTPGEISNWRVAFFRWFIDLQGIIGPKAKGTVKEEIVSTGKSTDYDSGSIVKLTAVPSDGYALMKWNKNGVLDTLNPIQITIDENKAIDVNFDYQTARDLVGTWEFDLQDSESAKSQGKILMKISIEEIL